MKILFCLLTLFIQSVACCQDDALDFSPLSAIDTISAIHKMESLVKADHLVKKDFFFTKEYSGNSGLYLVKKENNHWVIYDFELNLQTGPNTAVKNIKKESNRFVSVQLSRSPSGTCASSYGIIILLDITLNAFIQFFNFNEMDCNDGKATNCKASFYIENNLLKIKSSKRKNDGLFCIESGKYYYEKGKFKKLMK